jgi:putative ABC transport system substrate-binding protein
VSRLSRRQFVGGAGVAGLGLVAGCGQWPGQTERAAQPPPKAARIGFLSGAVETSYTATLDVFQQALAELGYVGSNSIIIETRFAGGQADRLHALAAELVQMPVELIVAPGTVAVRAAKEATASIPIIMVRGDDPVAFGLVESLARPGGNVTGLTIMVLQLAGKRLELLKDAFPGLSRVGVLWNPAITERIAEFTETEVAARALHVQLVSLEVRQPSDLDAAFDVAMSQGIEGLLTLDNILTVIHANRIAAFAAKSGLPLISQNRELAEAGGLMFYGSSNVDQFRRAAYYVDRILKGTKPADLPVEQPMRFDFVVNMKTAQALGITFPNEIMLQVTEVIQ